MGVFESKSEPEPIYIPPPSPEFRSPWRTMHWEKKRETEERLRNLQVNQTNVQFVRILLVGDIGAGKSSFINSVNNVFQKRITSEALTNAIGGSTSFTKQYTTHYIEGKDGSHLSFVFNDIMGLETGEAGANSGDIINALKGILKEGYNFEDLTKSNRSNAYRSNPTLEDQTYCLVNIMSADAVSRMNSGVIEKMKKIREAATNMNMPQVVVMTKPDLACPLVGGNLRKIYTSKKIKQKMQECSNLVGVPMNYIFPVKNYHEEMDTDDDMDALILKALDQIVSVAFDALKKRSGNSSVRSE